MLWLASIFNFILLRGPTCSCRQDLVTRECFQAFRGCQIKLAKSNMAACQRQLSCHFVCCQLKKDVFCVCKEARVDVIHLGRMLYIMPFGNFLVVCVRSRLVISQWLFYLWSTMLLYAVECSWLYKIRKPTIFNNDIGTILIDVWLA